jgi:hypothetical protein
VYNIWEASSVSEAASNAGLGSVFSAEDAMRYATFTEGHTSLEGATGMFSQAAQLLLRMRHEVDINKFNLTTDDLIDLSLQVPLRSGRSAAETLDNINRAVLSAQKTLGQQAKPFSSFTPTGTPRRASLGGLRES